MRDVQHNSRGARGFISASAIAIALAIGSPAVAQSDTATLLGHVDGAAAGTVVVAIDTHTGQRVTGVVDADGNYQILGLRPSTYRIEIAGKAAREATVFVGETGVVDFAGDGREIVVTGVAPRREVRTQTVSTNITPAQIENLPQNQRNFLSFAALAPGVQLTAPSGAQQVQAGAISASNTNVLLDGMSLKNLTNHGGVFGQNFGLGNPFPQIAIQEYKVETQNFGAESGQVGSALITAVTKTGGNAFHGSAFVEFQPRQFIEQPFFEKRANRPKGRYNRKQFGGDLGGPIIPDKLTFYIAGEGTNEKLPGSSGLLGTSNPATLGYPGSVTSAIDGVAHNFDFNQGLYFGKLTWYAGSNDTVNASAFIRRENNLSDIDRNAAPSHGRTISTHEDRYQLQWKHAAGDLLNVLNLSYDKASQSTPSVGTGPEFILSTGASADFSTGAQFGAHFFTQGDSQKQFTIKDDLTWRRGDHTLKVGGQLAFFDLSRSVSNRFNGTYYFANPGAGGSFDPAVNTPYGFRINVQPTSTLAAKDTQIGVYVQDQWKPDEHWTLNAGVRWDYESNANNNHYVTPAAIATALRNYAGWQARGINPEDYISDGSNRKPQWTQFQPRFGFSYDVKGDRDLVVFGGAGRYYDRSLFIEGVIESLTNSNNIVTGLFCSPTVTSNCTNFTSALRDPANLRTAVAATGTGGEVWVLNNHTKAPYSDQFDLGIRKRLGDIQLSVTVSHIRSHNIFQFVRANFYPNGWFTRNVTWQRDGSGKIVNGPDGLPIALACSNGGDAFVQDTIGGATSSASAPGCAIGSGILPGFSGKLNRGANDGKASYTALYVQLEKPFTDQNTWGFTSALTVQRARSNDAAPELNSDEFFNGARQDAYGYNFVAGVEDWRWVTTANYRAPWGISLSGTATFSSGPRFGHIDFANAPDSACCSANFGGVFSPKPFVGYKRVDLRVAKTFRMPFGDGHELTVDFQAFNVFNWLNRTYSAWGAGSGTTPSLVEDGQVGNDARSFQAGIKYKF